MLTWKVKCRGCGKSDGIIKFYILADDLSAKKAYHPACVRKVYEQVIKKLSDALSQISE